MRNRLLVLGILGLVVVALLWMLVNSRRLKSQELDRANVSKATGAITTQVYGKRLVPRECPVSLSVDRMQWATTSTELLLDIRLTKKLGDEFASQVKFSVATPTADVYQAVEIIEMGSQVASVVRTVRIPANTLTSVKLSDCVLSVKSEFFFQEFSLRRN